MATRQARPEEFIPVGVPTKDHPVETFCEDHVGTYAFRSCAAGTMMLGKMWIPTVPWTLRSLDGACLEVGSD
jgi:hypothetical protein